MPKNWMEHCYKRDGEIPLVDEKLLEEMEANPKAFFTNSYRHCKTYLGRWKAISEHNIKMIGDCYKNATVENYVQHQRDILERIKVLQNEWVKE